MKTNLEKMLIKIENTFTYDIKPLTNPQKMKILAAVLSTMELRYERKKYDFTICVLIKIFTFRFDFGNYSLEQIQNIFGLTKYNVNNKGSYHSWFSCDKQGSERRIKIIKELINEFEQLN